MEQLKYFINTSPVRKCEACGKPNKNPLENELCRECKKDMLGL